MNIKQALSCDNDYFIYFYAKVYNAENNDNTRDNLKKIRSKEDPQEEINDKKNLDWMRNRNKDDKDGLRDDQKEENSVKKEKNVSKSIEVDRFIVYHIQPVLFYYIHI